MTTNLTAIAFGHNLEKVKYPWRKTIMSVLPVVDEFILVLAGPHDDDTEQAVWDFQYSLKEDGTGLILNNIGEKLRVVKDKWPNSHTGLSNLANLAVEYASTKWVFQSQLDELFDEADYDELLRLPQLPSNYMAASFGFRHFCGDFQHTFPFIYQRVVRAFRTDSDFLFVGDASEAAGHGDVYSSSVTVNHVGKVHVGREEAAAFKEYMFQDQLYAHGKAFGDVDPLVLEAFVAGKLDFFKVFGETVKRGDVKEYNGPYCKYVREWAHELGVELG